MGRIRSSLEKISWDKFFRKFNDGDLALLYQDQTSPAKPVSLAS